MRLEEGHRLMLHDQHWVTEQGFWNGIKKGLTKVFEKGSQAYAWVRQQLGHGRYLGFKTIESTVNIHSAFNIHINSNQSSNNTIR